MPPQPSNTNNTRMLEARTIHELLNAIGELLDLHRIDYAVLIGERRPALSVVLPLRDIRPPAPATAASLQEDELGRNGELSADQTPANASASERQICKLTLPSKRGYVVALQLARNNGTIELAELQNLKSALAHIPDQLIAALGSVGNEIDAEHCL